MLFPDTGESHLFHMLHILALCTLCIIRQKNKTLAPFRQRVDKLLSTFYNL